MTDTVEVIIHVAPETAAVLAAPEARARLERLVEHTFRPNGAEVERLFAAIDALKADAHARGLTDELVEAELAAHKAERLERLKRP
jgi:hypothetical protein